MLLSMYDACFNVSCLFQSLMLVSKYHETMTPTRVPTQLTQICLWVSRRGAASPLRRVGPAPRLVGGAASPPAIYEGANAPSNSPACLFRLAPPPPRSTKQSLTTRVLCSCARRPPAFSFLQKRAPFDKKPHFC